ncbi:MAG: type II toxin-antitoxin system VapC family toxin [Acidimicrobiales bacterium]
MIVDSSAIVAILLRQPGFEGVLDLVEPATPLGIGAPTLAETGLVLTARLGLPARSLLARFLDESDMAVVPFGRQHWDVAVGAFARFGKGRHRAALNFGDCLTYAIARLADEPLLCLGDDFARTDLAIVS